MFGNNETYKVWALSDKSSGKYSMIGVYQCYCRPFDKYFDSDCVSLKWGSVEFLSTCGGVILGILNVITLFITKKLSKLMNFQSKGNRSIFWFYNAVIVNILFIFA